ncbi:MAG: NADH-quinone oxidoreductase subunit F, partial [Chloroflexi bacterium]|nr:NADH-quinone oxidoreductase subunit F [Chloroflexota bacterium]
MSTTSKAAIVQNSAGETIKEVKRVVVGLGTCGLAAGAREVHTAFQAQLPKATVDVKLGQTGCIGLCYREVIVDIYDGSNKRSYGNVTPDMVPRIIQEDLVDGEPIEEWLLVEDEFLGGQKRIVLRNCGIIDPEEIDDCLEHGGYRALKKALTEMVPQDVIDGVKQSGLRGRGGAGFSTGMKWQFTADVPGDKKYFICNADEGDPGAFMDRSVLEGDPHAILEGVAIAGYATGADEGIIYCRAEYPLAIKRLKIAIEQAHERGFLGKEIMGTEFNFDIRIKEGAGAFVCGEETALIASIEGKRGMPRVRPPFPSVSGLWGKPTTINNVETLASVPWIIYSEDGQARAVGGRTVLILHVLAIL